MFGESSSSSGQQFAGLESTSSIVVPDQAIAQFRDSSRFWIQRVAVPVITVIGMFGNTITIIIMTRRGMRSTTNLYLAALAFCDMLYLVLTFLLGLEHYPNMSAPEYYLYWKFKPFLMMSTDACSNTSVWLTVTFTIERYIAVKYPMKGKVWCTESRAKLLILFVFIFGILFATPVPFEWEVVKRNVIIGNDLKNKSKLNNENENNNILIANKIDDDNNNNNNNDIIDSQGTFVWALDYSDFGKNDTYKTIYYRSTAAIFYIIPLISLIYFNFCLIRSVHQSSRERSEMTGGGGGGGGASIKIKNKKSTTFESNNSISSPKVVVDFSINSDSASDENKINNNPEATRVKHFDEQNKDTKLNSSQSLNCKAEQMKKNQPLVEETNEKKLRNSDLTLGGESTELTIVQLNCDNNNNNNHDELSIENSKLLSEGNLKDDDNNNNNIKNSSNELISLGNHNGKLNYSDNSISNQNNSDISLASIRSSPTKRFFKTKSNNNNNNNHCNNINNSHYQHQHSLPHTTQERRITIMLISVVILFLCCQLPSAIMILYTATRELKPNSNEHALVLAFGNIFNFLMAVNAAGNFILYSLLSKKYRRTFVRLFCNCFMVNKKNNKQLTLHKSLNNNNYNCSNTSTNNRERNAKTFSVRFEAVGSIRNKAYQINKSSSDTLV